MAIHFGDGKPDDIAMLKRFNPIPKQANEPEASIDSCIFRGNLLLESEVSVVLTGGCPFEDTFEVKIFYMSGVRRLLALFAHNFFTRKHSLMTSRKQGQRGAGGPFCDNMYNMYEVVNTILV